MWLWRQKHITRLADDIIDVTLRYRARRPDRDAHDAINRVIDRTVCIIETAEADALRPGGWLWGPLWAAMRGHVAG